MQVSTGVVTIPPRAHPSPREAGKRITLRLLREAVAADPSGSTR